MALTSEISHSKHDRSPRQNYSPVSACAIQRIEQHQEICSMQMVPCSPPGRGGVCRDSYPTSAYTPPPYQSTERDNSLPASPYSPPPFMPGARHSSGTSSPYSPPSHWVEREDNYPPSSPYSPPPYSLQESETPSSPYTPPPAEYALPQPDIPIAQWQTRIPGNLPAPYYHEYGDCSESLPLAALTNLPSIQNRVAARSVAAFSAKLCSATSITEDGPLKVPLKLREPCLNCKSLFQLLPSTLNILAASGWSHDIQWIGGETSTHVARGIPTNPILQIQRQDQTRRETLFGRDFSLCVAFGATKQQIYGILADCIFSNTNPLISTNLGRSLVDIWHEFIVPNRYADTLPPQVRTLSDSVFRILTGSYVFDTDTGTLFRVDRHGNLDPLIITVNHVRIPFCTIFCALGLVLSTVLWPDRVRSQQAYGYLPQMALFAKWCWRLSPKGHPRVISVVYIPDTTKDVELSYLLGTSKPTPGGAGPKLRGQMRMVRRAVLEERLGRLPSPCPLALEVLNQP